MKFKAIVIILSVLALITLFIYQSFRFFDGKLHLVFCDVGQGDAIFIRTPSGADILVDGGPLDSGYTKVLDCLSSHMPFWDRTLELVLLSHPHADHYEGLREVIKQYRIKTFATEELKNTAAGYIKLEKEIVDRKIVKQFLLAGDTFRFSDGVVLSILAPSTKFLLQTSPNGLIGESQEFASVIPHISYKNFSLLLTGDSQARGLEQALDTQNTGNVTVLQVPHHGSKTGLNQSLIERLNPYLAVISVGIKNTYHHPHPSIIILLEKNKIQFKTTANHGTVEILSDGEKMIVK